MAAIKSLKKRKVPGQDSVKVELFKTDPEFTVQVLQPLLTAIWEEKELPEDWTEDVIVKIPKKGSLSNCNNWRGITLLSIPSKILAKITIRWISEAVDQRLRQEQVGFRKGRGCTDQIFTLQNIIEQCREWQRQLYINYLDFEKAFDSIYRESLWHIIRAYGIPQEIVLVIKSFYNNFKCRVDNSNTSFNVKTGVRQGCCMSLLLLNLTIDCVMRQTTADQPQGMRWTVFSTLEDLDFADDLALLSHKQHMEEKTSQLSMYAQQVGLKVSQKKTKVMMLNISNPAPVKVNGEDLPTTEESLTSEAQSDTMAEQAATSGIASVRQGMPSEC